MNFARKLRDLPAFRCHAGYHDSQRPKALRGFRVHRVGSRNLFQRSQRLDLRLRRPFSGERLASQIRILEEKPPNARIAACAEASLLSRLRDFALG